MKLKTVMLTISAITTGLIAGLFFGFQVAIIPAFKSLSDANYIAAVQSINDVIQKDPFFLLCFLGAAFFLSFAAYLYRKKPGSARFLLLVAAALLYIIGTLGITFLANIPLNDGLATFLLHSSTARQTAIARSTYEMPWNAWHLIRTYTSLGSLLLVIAACLYPEPDTFPVPTNLSKKGNF